MTIGLSPEEQINVDSIQKQNDAYYANKSLSGATDVGASDGIDTQYAGLLDKATSGLSTAFEDQTKGIMDRYDSRKLSAEEGFGAQQQLTTNQFGEAITQQEDVNLREKTSLEESRRGFATNTALFRQTSEDARKRVTDLEKQRDSLLLQGKALHAERMDNLIVDEQESITKSRQQYLDNLFSITNELRAQRSFESPEEKRVNDLASKNEETLQNMRLSYADVPGVQEAKSMEDMIVALGPRLAKDRANELAQSSLDQKYKQAQIDYQNTLNKAKIADTNAVTAGALDDIELARVDKTDEAKKLRSMYDLKVKMANYKNMIEVYGYGLAGAQKTLIDNAYTTLQIAWKEAAELGALQGPDMALIESAIKPVSGFGGIKTALTGGGKSAVLSQITQGINNIDAEGQEYYSRLVSRDPRYSNSEYIGRLGQPFFDPNATATFTSDDRSLSNTDITSTASSSLTTPSFIED